MNDDAAATENIEKILKIGVEIIGKVNQNAVSFSPQRQKENRLHA